ncbi:MAG: ATP-binding protein [Candidatus Bathyarchaeia archaeon]|jgi:PAS domain S-box-containing protein
MVNSSGEIIQEPVKPPRGKNYKSIQPAKRSKVRIAADILESIDDYISAFDRNWTIIYLNKTTAKDFGFKPETLIGKNFWKTFPKFLGTDVEKIYRETMRLREIRRFEWKTIYANTGYVEFTVFPSVEGITVYGVNITERKQLQQKLEDYAKNLERIVEERTRKICESEQSYRELYDSFGEAFIATDWELNVIHWNKAAERVTNVKAKDALGKKVYDVLPEMASVDVTPYFESLQQRKPARFMMNIISRETGRASIFEISTYPSTLGIIIIVEDKTTEEETKRLSAIGQTAGMVGHDIRNPLQSITSSMFLIEYDLANLPESEEKESAKQEMKSIYEQISYVDKIISDLQDYARPLKPELAEVDIKRLVTGCLATLNIPENIKAYAYFNEKTPKLRTDPTLLKRVLLNLATNAVQAMPNGGELNIQASQDETSNNFILTIKDTGVGIPKEMHEKIFTPLFTTKSKGQGLGLAVVKRLIEALNGTITFESQEGKGTKFTVTLPQNKKAF